MGVAPRDWRCADTIARTKLVRGLLTVLLLLTLAQPARPQAGRGLRTKPPAPASESGLFRADVKLILIPVSVTDDNGATATGLRAADFKVFEDGAERPIVSFSSQDAPCSVGIVFDVSGSMSTKTTPSRLALKAFLDAADSNDEVFLMTFADRPVLRIPFTRDFATVQNSFLFEKPRGGTAMIDAIHEALLQVRAAHNMRKALLVISDGGDNQSRFSKGQLMTNALEADAQIYSIAIPARPRAPTERTEEAAGLSLFTGLAERTGGRYSELSDIGKLPSVMDEISRALRNQYLIGIHPAENSAAGKWASDSRKSRVQRSPAPPYRCANEVLYSRRVTIRSGGVNCERKKRAGSGCGPVTHLGRRCGLPKRPRGSRSRLKEWRLGVYSTQLSGPNWKFWYRLS